MPVQTCQWTSHTRRPHTLPSLIDLHDCSRGCPQPEGTLLTTCDRGYGHALQRAPSYTSCCMRSRRWRWFRRWVSCGLCTAGVLRYLGLHHRRRKRYQNSDIQHQTPHTNIEHHTSPLWISLVWKLRNFSHREIGVSWHFALFFWASMGPPFLPGGEG